MTCVTNTNLLQSHSSHIHILRDNSIYDHSYTYNILSHLFISGDMICIAIDNGSITILLEDAVTLHIKLEANSPNTTLIWSDAFIANARLELVYLHGDVNKTLECVTKSDSKSSNRVLV